MSKNNIEIPNDNLEIDGALTNIRAMNAAIAQGKFANFVQQQECRNTPNVKCHASVLEPMIQSFISEAKTNFNSNTGMRVRQTPPTFPLLSTFILVFAIINVCFIALICIAHLVSPSAVTIYWLQIIFSFATGHFSTDPADIAQATGLPSLLLIRTATSMIVIFFLYRLVKFAWASHNNARFYYVSEGSVLPSSSPRRMVRYNLYAWLMLVLSAFLAIYEPTLTLLTTMGAAYHFFERSNSARVPEGRILLESDSRRPIIFLRSFDEEDTFLIRNEYGLRIYDVIENAAARLVSTVGPFVAVGNPRGRHPIGNAARLMIPDGEWQKEVINLCQSSRLILMVAGESKGLLWEVETVIIEGHITRTIILFPEDPEHTTQARLKHLRVAFKSTGWLSQLYSIDPRDLIGLIFGHEAIIPIYSNKKTAEAYQMACICALYACRQVDTECKDFNV